MFVEFWLENLKERFCLENTDIKEKIIFELILKKYDQVRGMFIRIMKEQKVSRSFVCIHQKGQEGDLTHYKDVIYKRYVPQSSTVEWKCSSPHRNR